MGRTARTARAALLQSGPLDQRICSSCRRNIQIRHAATAAASVPNPEPTPDLIDQRNPSVITSTAPHQAYKIRAGVLLSRPPVLTRDLTQFEKAFYLYQRRLNERTALNFTRYFYYRQDTAQEKEWKRKIKERVTPARDIGKYNAHSKDGWNDEALIGAPESEPTNQWNALLKDAATEVEEENPDGSGEKIITRTEAERPMPRETEADKTGDTKRLDRALQRTLYLLVKNKDGKWEFPADAPIGKEGLHRVAERVLVEGTGPNMNTWLIARHPVGWHKHSYEEAVEEADTKIERLGEKTFFIKGRIIAGQADLANTKLGYTDFKWLSKDEIEKEVDPKYWSSIKNMLVAL